MAVRSITLSLPEALYERIKQRAQQLNHTVEDEVVELVATNLGQDDKLPADLEQIVAQMKFLDDKALWRAARSHFSKKSATRLESLQLKRQREDLTEEERQTVKSLLRESDRTMLIRAQAMALLKERGHDISELIKPK